MLIGQDDDGRRIDRILRKAFKDFPLSFIHRLIRKKQVLINNIPVKIDTRVQKGDVLSVKGSIEMPERTKKPEPICHSGKLDILYEGSGLLILNKPAGLEVHGPKSLETMARVYLRDVLPPSLSFKPGPLHRLDKPTSGIIAFSKSLDGARRFSEALQNGKIKKMYIALMDGIIKKKETWEDTLFRDHDNKKTIRSEQEGQQAVLTVHPLMTSIDTITSDTSNSQYSLVLIELKTGRTHQIRAQGAIHHHPLAGDKKYGGSFLPGGFFLHAWILSIPSEIAPDLPSFMTAPLPKEWEKPLTSIFGNKTQKLYQNPSHESFFIWYNLNDV